MLKEHLRRHLYVFSVIVLVALVIGVRTTGAQNEQANLVTAIETVAKQAIPAVVHVEVTERQAVQNPLLPFENEPFFKYFFGNPKHMPKEFQREIEGLGSGIIIDDSGHILTNYHVVGGATTIHVVLADGREFSGKSIKTVGTDPKTDLAVIQIVEKGPLPHIPLGDSDKTAVGQWVIAIGQPRGLSETVTQGIISAKHRTGISDPSSYEDYLQTDAAINPGNSGGPLVNLKGEVIGINAAIMSESGGFEGLGFAIPTNIAKHISKELIEHGKVTRGWLGVGIQKITPALAKSLGLSSTKGALVASVVKGGPADQAGIKKGDVIVDFQGQPVDNPSALRNGVSLATVNSQVKLTIVRDGAKRDITIKIGSQEDEQKAISDSLRQEFGIEVSSMPQKQANTSGPSSPSGVVITQVEPQGPFGKAGFEKGDVIVEIDNQPVNNADILFSILSSLKPKQRVTVTVVDHKTGQPGNVFVTLP